MELTNVAEICYEIIAEIKCCQRYKTLQTLIKYYNYGNDDLEEVCSLIDPPLCCCASRDISIQLNCPCLQEKQFLGSNATIMIG